MKEKYLHILHADKETNESLIVLISLCPSTEDQPRADCHFFCVWFLEVNLADFSVTFKHHIKMGHSVYSYYTQKGSGLEDK